MNKTYICADIHGDLPGFHKLLDTIKFDNSDHMIIAGDVLDRGKYGLELFEDIQSRENMTLLLGNHEMFAMMYLIGELEGSLWKCFGGEDTLNGILKMDDRQKSELLLKISSLPLYTDVDSPKYGKCLVTHTGIDVENLVYTSDERIDVKASIDRAYSVNSYDYMCGRDIHYAPAGVLKALNQFIILGHVPTHYINEDGSDNAYRCEYYMNIDCGRGKSADGKICCYDVADDSEIYVS